MARRSLRVITLTLITFATHSGWPTHTHTQMATTNQVAEPCDGMGGPCMIYFIASGMGLGACYAVRHDRLHNDVRLVNDVRLTFPSSHHHTSHNSAPSARTCAASTAFRAEAWETSARTRAVTRALFARSMVTPRRCLRVGNRRNLTESFSGLILLHVRSRSIDGCNTGFEKKDLRRNS